MLQEAWLENPDFESFNFDNDDEIHWCPRIPSARPFPEGFFAAFSWDLRNTCVQYIELQTQIAIRKKDVPQFVALFPEPDDTFLRVDSLSPLWVGRYKQKTKHLRMGKVRIKGHK